MTVGEVIEWAASGHARLLDASSVLVGRSVTIDRDVTLWPGVILETADDHQIRIGANCELMPGVHVCATAGTVKVGSGCFFDNGTRAKANAPGSDIKIGDNVRLLNGALVIGRSVIGDGCQVIGLVTVQDCTLESGAPYTEADASLRGGLLKGFGLARSISVPRGMVIEGTGAFSETDLVSQLAYHPKEARK